jgi:hypothetical protein
VPGATSRISGALLLVLAAGCVDAQINRLGPNRPARPEGCSVDLFPDGKPPYPVVDVASGTVSCSGKRDRCLAEIRKVACTVGADTVYGFSESGGGGFTNISGTYAAREPP